MSKGFRQFIEAAARLRGEGVDATYDLQNANGDINTAASIATKFKSEKVAVASSADDTERVERTVLQVGEGILGQDFEPRPSFEVCSWCAFRRICPASEA